MCNFSVRAFSGSLLAATLAMASSGSAATFVIDGTEATYTRLSDAVTSAVDAGPGPHVINITTNSLSTPDTEVVVSTPLTIEGDADGDGVACDILVDTLKMTPDSWISPGYPGVAAAHVKTYFELNTAGNVTINNLKIRPNSANTTTINRRKVNAIRMYVPLNEGELGNYTLNNVKVSGSDADLNYIDLDTGEELFENTPNVWASSGSAQNSVILLEDGPTGAQGRYNATLNNCHAGLGRSGALCVMNTSGTTVINGGLYGHAALDGINLEGTSITLTGSLENRLRVVQAPHVTGSNAHGIRVWRSGDIDLIEYADVLSTLSTSVNINVIGGTVHKMQYVRGLGKPDTEQNTMHVTELGQVNMEDCTLNGSGLHANPFQVSNLFDGAVNIKDSIFTSENFGFIRNDNDDLVGLLTISNSAIAADGWPNESLNTDTPTTSPDQPASIVLTNNISASPHYLLPASAYDWSDNQGADNPLNGAGNRNVLRPSNPVYLTASSTGGSLVGGAGPAPSGIDSSQWMLLE